RDRGADRGAVRILRGRGARDSSSPRALGRLRVSRRPHARRDSARGAHRGGSGRFRRAHLRALVSAGAQPWCGPHAAACRGGSHARGAGRRRVARRARARGTLSVYALNDPWPPRRAGLLSGMPLLLLVALGVLTAGAGVLAACEIVPLTPARAIAAG